MCSCMSAERGSELFSGVECSASLQLIFVLSGIREFGETLFEQLALLNTEQNCSCRVSAIPCLSVTIRMFIARSTFRGTYS